MSTDQNGELLIFGFILVVLTLFFGVLFYLFNSLWIVALGVVCTTLFALGFAYLDRLNAPPQLYAKRSLDSDDRGWRRFDRRAA